MTAAYAQTPTPTTGTTPMTQQIISETRNACSEVTAPEFISECISVIHDSATTVPPTASSITPAAASSSSILSTK